MRNINEDSITQAVIGAMAGCKNPRLLSVMTSLVQHLHAFAREVALTEDEWFEGIKFLTAAGNISDDKRQEFIPLSDVLGLSTLVTAQNNLKPEGCTESTVFGPFFVDGAPKFDNGDDIANGAKGTPCFVRGTVKSLDGRPIAGAVIDVWQSDEEGFYDVQSPIASGEHEHRARGQLRSDAEGGFNFRSILAHHYPIPHDGPVGAMLDALDRHPWRPAHLHFMIEAPGHERLITHIFREGGEYLDSDAVFGVRGSLIVDWPRQEGGFHTLDHDFVLNPVAAP
ncbi:Hydroxyquinol 1,2-dioxygenase [Variovorax boronicumulans]|uniref:intradiol ring-cleavage dioxygenase n=1 Tax=Variovorax boronicumulans TaxID=436515 RepID=UPI000BB35818|nr:intradiol ring-cleavage dioxygenase [Variovorax boronicumulans]PBI89295.1 Hydroxyquinol 1,2-dioxygenase [Variovorax boronicumulans]